MATTILGGAFAALTFFVSGVGIIKSPKTPVLACASIGLSLVGFCGFVVAVILYIFVYQQWYYCNENYCNKAFALNGESGSCDAFFSYSYALVVIAAGSSLAGTVFSFVAFTTIRNAGNAAAANNTQSSPPRGTAAAEPTANAKTPGRAVTTAASPAAKQNVKQATRQAPAQAAGGMEGWELDERNGLYWSDKEMLFYDPNSGHFYDPNSELWYDPQTEQWYQGAEN